MLSPKDQLPRSARERELFRHRRVGLCGLCCPKQANVACDVTTTQPAHASVRTQGSGMWGGGTFQGKCEWEEGEKNGERGRI